VPTCIRCRRDTDPPTDDLEVRLDGPEMLAAIRETDREELDEAQRAFVEALEAGLCPACGRAV
jgi:hypothetical protein